MELPDGAPPLPVIRLDEIFRLRDQLLEYQAPLWSLESCSLDKVSARSLARDLLPYLRGADYDCVYETLRPLVGRSLADQEVFDLAWRLAAHRTALHEKPVRPWTLQAELEWMPVQIVSTRWHKDKRTGLLGYRFRFKFLAGSACAMNIDRFWTMARIRVAARWLGFSQRSGRHLSRMESAEELVNLRMLALIEPQLSRGEPGFIHLRCPAPMLRYNRDILRMRRRDGFECPHRFSHPCHRCPLGLQDCPAATHPYSYVLGLCQACKCERLFDVDPGYRNRYCIRCESMLASGVPMEYLAKDSD